MWIIHLLMPGFVGRSNCDDKPNPSRDSRQGILRKITMCLYTQASTNLERELWQPDNAPKKKSTWMRRYLASQHRLVEKLLIASKILWKTCAQIDRRRICNSAFKMNPPKKNILMKKTADQQQQKQELLQTDWLISMAWEFESMKTDKNKPGWKVQKTKLRSQATEKLVYRNKTKKLQSHQSERERR